MYYIDLLNVHLLLTVLFSWYIPQVTFTTCCCYVPCHWPCHWLCCKFAVVLRFWSPGMGVWLEKRGQLHMLSHKICLAIFSYQSSFLFSWERSCLFLLWRCGWTMYCSRLLSHTHLSLSLLLLVIYNRFGILIHAFTRAYTLFYLTIEALL